MNYVFEGNRKRPASYVKCSHCGKRFLRSNIRLRRIKKIGVKRQYCSRECVSEDSKKRIKVSCVVCGKEKEITPSVYKKSKSGLFFCGKECKDFGQKIENCHKDMMPSHFNNGYSTYRAKAFRSYSQKCEICGYDKYKKILEVHHIDGDRLNNNIDNLIILCSNCHKTITYKICFLDENRNLIHV